MDTYKQFNQYEILKLLDTPTKKNLTLTLEKIIQPAVGFMSDNKSGLKLGNTSALCPENVAHMEGLSRLFWGIFPALATNNTNLELTKLIEALKKGTDPQHPEYWGDITSIDQRTVEAAVYGFGFCIAPEEVKKLFEGELIKNLTQWLTQTETCEVADSNWRFFPILIQVGLFKMGLKYNKACIEQHFVEIEKMYLGNGWYSDGPGRPKDYYISMGFHFYSLLYVKFMKDVDPERCQILLSRAEKFSHDYITLFSGSGDDIPFGRSLTYRFAHVAYWSAMIYIESKEHSLETMKGIILKNIRWWIKKPIFDNSGILSIGYSYPNLIMAEDYNSPGSPYWCLKSFLFLALDDEHDFWKVDEGDIPILDKPRMLLEAGKIVSHQQSNDHRWFITSGQIELNNYVNTDAKYTKFSYSNKYGFCLDRGRFGLNHTPIDSMLYLSEYDEYYRGRRYCTKISINENFIYSQWLPWENVIIDTWLVVYNDSYIRIHKINSQRKLKAIEGGWPVPKFEISKKLLTNKLALCEHNKQNVFIQSIHGDSVTPLLHTTPPNSNVLFSEQAVIPAIESHIEIGESWLISLSGSKDTFKQENFNFNMRNKELTINENIIFSLERMRL